MADYYPLLARALDALPDRSAAMRKAVYERARNALVGQLRSLEPPLAEDDIALESQALDNAIARLEGDYAEAPPASVELPEPAPPEVSASVTPAIGPEASVPEPALPPAAAPHFLPPAAAQPPDAPLAEVPPPVPLPPRDVAVPIRARRIKLQAEDRAVSPEPPAPGNGPPDSALDPGNGRQRPRIDVVAPRGDRSRLLRNALVGIVLTVAIGLIAVAAFFLRDKPASLQAGTSEVADTQKPDGADAKYADRVGGGEPAPKERPSPTPVQPSQPRMPAPLPVQPDVAIAQRAVLIEETMSAQDTPPTTSAGRVVWRLDSVAGEQGQPLETAVVATVSFPAAGLSLVMTLQRNLDATLPASHTINLVFTGAGAEGEARSVQDVGLLQAKDEENGRGSPVSGLPVRVRENLFLIGLSSLKNDVERNTDLLLHKAWFDIAVRYANGRRAVLTFEKGASGTQALQAAFDQWQ